MRGDEWGTDRLRFAREVLEAVRAAVGPDAVVGLRLSCDELAPWAGIVPEAAAEIAVALADLVDYLAVVRGSIFSSPPPGPTATTEPGFNLDLAAPSRAAVAGRCRGGRPGLDRRRRPGGVRPSRDGIAATRVEMTRAQIADPDLVAKLAAGEPSASGPASCATRRARCATPATRS